MKAPTSSLVYCNLTRSVMILIIMLGISSCVTKKKTTYLQVYDTIEDTTSVTPTHYRVKPFDNIYIRVVTPDPRLATMFNILPITTGTASVNAHSMDLISYTVKVDGTINVPFLGDIQVAGMTISEIQVVLETAMADYISDAAITVKLVNNFVSVIGEVNRPGLYPIFKEQLNVFQALSMASDLAPFSDRGNVQIIRKTDEGKVVKTIDLKDKKLIYSEDYYILPNDIIYVPPMKGKFFQMDRFPFALILSTVTAAILLYGVLN